MRAPLILLISLFVPGSLAGHVRRMASGPVSNNCTQQAGPCSAGAFKLTVDGGCITYADGTVQCTSASGGGGGDPYWVDGGSGAFIGNIRTTAPGGAVAHDFIVQDDPTNYPFPVDGGPPGKTELFSNGISTWDDSAFTIVLNGGVGGDTYRFGQDAKLTLPGPVCFPDSTCISTLSETYWYDGGVGDWSPTATATGAGTDAFVRGGVKADGPMVSGNSIVDTGSSVNEVMRLNPTTGTNKNRIFDAYSDAVHGPYVFFGTIRDITTEWQTDTPGAYVFSARAGNSGTVQPLYLGASNGHGAGFSINANVDSSMTFEPNTHRIGVNTGTASLSYALQVNGQGAYGSGLVVTGAPVESVAGEVIGPSGQAISGSYAGSVASIGFDGGSIAPDSCINTPTDAPVAGAAVGAPCVYGLPGAGGKLSYYCFVFAPDTVFLTVCNPSAINTVTPHAGPYSIRVFNP